MCSLCPLPTSFSLLLPSAFPSLPLFFPLPPYPLPPSLPSLMPPPPLHPLPPGFQTFESIPSAPSPSFWCPQKAFSSLTTLWNRECYTHLRAPLQCYTSLNGFGCYLISSQDEHCVQERLKKREASESVLLCPTRHTCISRVSVWFLSPSPTRITLLQ